MTTQEMPVDVLKDWNGHFRSKNDGDTLYKGELQSLPYPTGPVSTADAIQAMYDDGYVIFPGVFSKDEVATLRARFDAMGGPDEKYVVAGWCFNKQLSLDLENDPNSLEYIDKPGVIEVVDAIHGIPFGGKPSGAIVTGGSIWITGKGRQMPVHLDTNLITLPESIFDDPTVRVPIFKSTVHFYLNDMRADLGPTTVIPGSHKAGRPPVNESTWRGIGPKAVMVKAGDAMLFRSDLWHAAWMNSSEEKRYMIQVFYGIPYLAPGYAPMKYDHYWSKEVIEKATPRQRRLLCGGGKKSGTGY
jgi:hypothetical protein